MISQAEHDRAERQRLRAEPSFSHLISTSPADPGQLAIIQAQFSSPTAGMQAQQDDGPDKAA